MVDGIKVKVWMKIDGSSKTNGQHPVWKAAAVRLLDGRLIETGHLSMG